MLAAAQPKVDYTYDDADRLRRIAQGTETVLFDYDDVDRLSLATLPNGVAVGHTYDNADQLTGLAWQKAGQTSIGSIGYAYNSLGQIVTQTGGFSSQALPAASTGTNGFDDANRQLSYNSQALTYDNNGNLLSDGTRTYVWNVRDQLVQIKQGTTSIASFGYDALGRRYSKTEGGATTSYLYDGQNAVQEKVGTTVNPILTGLGIDQRFARNDANGRMYYLTDNLGSTRALTNAEGAVVRRYDYTPYGQAQATGGSSDNPYQYTGRELDKSGLQYYRARYYSPEMGRFISEDSYGFAGGDANFYAYTLGNPVSFNDPSGHIAWFAIPVIWAGIEFALSAYDAYDTGKTLMDPCASTNTKVLSASMFAAGLFLPGGGYGVGAKKVDQYALRAVEDGWYPVMTRGKRDATDLTWLNQGEVWKFGTTKNPATRYSQSYLDGIGTGGVRYSQEFQGARSEALMLERMKIDNAIQQTGSLPPGNKIRR
nr:RHS repeat-associated core domain-containing protein [Xanthomonas campestris]